MFKLRLASVGISAALLSFIASPASAQILAPSATILWNAPDDKAAAAPSAPAAPVGVSIASNLVLTNDATSQSCNVPATSFLQTCDCSSNWCFKVVPYGWLPSIRGSATSGDVTAPVVVTIGELWNIFTHDLNFGVMGQFEASNGSVGMIFNANFLDVMPGRQVDNLNIKSGIAITLYDFAATYELKCVPQILSLPCGSRFEVLAGARYIAFTTDFTATDPTGASFNRSGTLDWVDPFLGARVRIPFCKSLTGQLRGDMGGFSIGDASSHFTWNVEATLEHQCSERCSVFAGYRWLSFDHGNGGDSSKVGLDLTFSGPMVGLSLKF